MTDTQRAAFEAWLKGPHPNNWNDSNHPLTVGEHIAASNAWNAALKWQAAQAADAGRELPPLPPPYEIEWPELHSQALGCGVEDRNIRDRYEAAEYGWQDGVDKAVERVPEEIFTAEQMREYARAALARAKEQK